MTAIDSYYIAPRGLNRSNGLSINGRPDFLGLAAWFFDIYINSRYTGLDEIGARFNVMANITQTDEWRMKHPGQATAAPFPLRNMLPFDRSELLAVMETLDTVLPRSEAACSVRKGCPSAACRTSRASRRGSWTST